MVSLSLRGRYDRAPRHIFRMISKLHNLHFGQYLATSAGMLRDCLVKTYVIKISSMSNVIELHS